MDEIETLLSVDQLWFQAEINKLVRDGYSILHSNTICDNDNNIVWTAISLWRPAGIQIIIYPTHKTTTTLSIGVDVNSTILETQDFLDNVKLTIENYINNYTAVS